MIEGAAVPDRLLVRKLTWEQLLVRKLTWEQLAVRQVQPLEAPLQQGEPEQRSSRSQTFRGQEVQVPGHRLIEHLAGAHQLQTREAAAEHARMLAPQPADKVESRSESGWGRGRQVELCLDGSRAWTPG